MKKLILALGIIGLCTANANAEGPYTNVKVTKVTINKAPTTKMNGSEFDKDGHPDYYSVFSYRNTDLYCTNYKDNCTDFPIKYDLLKPFAIHNIDLPFRLTLMDYDILGENEVVYVFNNIVFSDYKTYPDQISIKGTNNEAEVTLKLQWYND